MPNLFTPVLGLTYTRTCTSRQTIAEVAAALALDGGLLFVVMPIGGEEYEITVRADQKRTLDAAFIAADKISALAD